MSCTSGTGAPGLERVDVVQPALFALMVSLARVWESHGIRPDAVIGHSQGEIAAAHVAGALSLDDAARIVCLRSQALVTLAGTGGMASIPSQREETTARLADYPGLHVAAHNGPESTVISGDATALAEMVAACQNEGIRARTIDVDYASHSPHIENLRPLHQTCSTASPPARPRSPSTPPSPATQLDTTELTADYWYRNLRHPVLFEPTLRLLHQEGHHTYIETSPHPVLTTPTQDTTATPPPSSAPSDATTPHPPASSPPSPKPTPTDTPPPPGPPPPPTTNPTPTPNLPTYPFQHQPYWLHSPASATTDGSAGRRAGRGRASSARGGVQLPDGEHLFTGSISLTAHPWLADHAVHGTVAAAGGGVRRSGAACRRDTGSPHLEELTLQAPLVLPEQGAVSLQVLLGAPDEETRRRSVTVHSRPRTRRRGATKSRSAAGPATRQACSHRARTGTAPTEAPARARPGRPPPTLRGRPPRPRRSTPLTSTRRSPAARSRLRPAFQGLGAAWRLGDDIYAEVGLPATEDRGLPAAQPQPAARPQPSRLPAPSGAARRGAAHGVPRGVRAAGPGRGGKWRCRSPGRGSRCTPPVPRPCGCG